MNHLRKSVFKRKESTGRNPEIARVCTTLASTLNRKALEILLSHMEELLVAPKDYIVCAIWGVESGRELDRVQKIIHEQILPAITETMETLKFPGMTPVQEFALSFLVKDVLVSKVLFLTETAKNQCFDTVCETGGSLGEAKIGEVAGSA